MKRAPHFPTEQPGPDPGPDVREPCAWCDELAVVVEHGPTALLECANCGISVEIGAGPAHQRRQSRLAAAA